MSSLQKNEKKVNNNDVKTTVNKYNVNLFSTFSKNI